MVLLVLIVIQNKLLTLLKRNHSQRQRMVSTLSKGAYLPSHISNNLWYEKTDLKVFVVVIPKEGWARPRAPVMHDSGIGIGIDSGMIQAFL